MKQTGWTAVWGLIGLETWELPKSPNTSGGTDTCCAHSADRGGYLSIKQPVWLQWSTVAFLSQRRRESNCPMRALRRPATVIPAFSPSQERACSWRVEE